MCVCVFHQCILGEEVLTEQHLLETQKMQKRHSPSPTAALPPQPGRKRQPTIQPNTCIHQHTKQLSATELNSKPNQNQCPLTPITTHKKSAEAPPSLRTQSWHPPTATEVPKKIPGHPHMQPLLLRAPRPDAKKTKPINKRRFETKKKKIQKTQKGFSIFPLWVRSSHAAQRWSSVTVRVDTRLQPRLGPSIIIDGWTGVDKCKPL